MQKSTNKVKNEKYEQYELINYFPPIWFSCVQGSITVNIDTYLLLELTVHISQSSENKLGLSSEG